MARELKLWIGNLDGRNQAAVATTTKKEAIKALGISASQFNSYFGEGALHCVPQAVEKPGSVWISKYSPWNSPWAERASKQQEQT